MYDFALNRHTDLSIHSTYTEQIAQTAFRQTDEHIHTPLRTITISYFIYTYIYRWILSHIL